MDGLLLGSLDGLKGGGGGGGGHAWCLGWVLGVFLIAWGFEVM